MDHQDDGNGIGGKKMRMNSEPYQPSYMVFSEVISYDPSQPQECAVVTFENDMETSHAEPEVAQVIEIPSSNLEEMSSPVSYEYETLNTSCLDTEPFESNNLPETVKEEGHQFSDHEKKPESKTLEDTTDIDRVINEDVARIHVKTLRAIVPRLRVICFLKEEEICGKKKMKNMWNERPIGYPAHVPFKDPNNKGQDGRKATKEELITMFEYLKQRYRQLQQNAQSQTVLVQNSVVSVPPQTAVEIKQEVVEPPRVRVDQPGSPFYDLMSRIREKGNRMLQMVSNDQSVVEKINKIFSDILKPLYQNASQMEAGCELLDVGHQFETLLDVAIVYGKSSMAVFQQGCDEIIVRFSQEKDEQSQTDQPMENVIAQVYLAQEERKEAPSLAPATGEPYLPLEKLGVQQRSKGPALIVTGLIEQRSDLTQPVVPDGPDVKKEIDELVEKYHREKTRGDILGEAMNESGIRSSESHNDLLDCILDMEDAYSPPSAQLKEEDPMWNGQESFVPQDNSCKMTVFYSTEAVAAEEDNSTCIPTTVSDLSEADMEEEVDMEYLDP